jgi:hypothetical protein
MNLSKLNTIRRFIGGLLRRKLEQKIFFMAIPKCGGTSVGFALRVGIGHVHKNIS